MNTIIAMTIRACLLGIRSAEAEDRSPEKYLGILDKLAGELERGGQAFAHPGAPAPEVRVVPAAEMHQSERDMLCEAGFVDVGELLSAYKTLVQSDQATRQRMAGLVNRNTELEEENRTGKQQYEELQKAPKMPLPFSAAQICRLYRNSPELTDRASSLHMSLIQFKNLVGLVERAHGIRVED